MRASSARGVLLERVYLLLDFLGPVEDVAELEQVGLVGHNLLKPERPLLVPGRRQAERLVPGGQLHPRGRAPSSTA
jgi:hypothetical protein